MFFNDYMQWRNNLKGLNLTDRSVKTAKKNHAGTLSPKRRKDENIANFFTWSSRNVVRGMESYHPYIHLNLRKRNREFNKTMQVPFNC